MDIQNFLIIVSGISIVTGLIVEAIKKTIECDLYNIIAGAVAVVLSMLVGVCYAVCVPVEVDARYVIFYLCVALASWLSAMLGFDKVKQALLQMGELK